MRSLSERAGPWLLCFLAVLLTVDIGLRVGFWRPLPRASGQAKGSAAKRQEGRRNATVRAVMRTGQTVANISTERIIKRRRRWGRLDLFDEFFEGYVPSRPQETRTRSLGSGIVIDGTGYLLTNAHVVAQASRILVTLSDGKTYKARLINLSEDHDLALLKIDAGKTIAAIDLGRSKELMIGETVIAIGNPFGLENTVTRGVVSAKDRRIIRDGRTLPGTFLQTDAAINPGNSGGALINIDAELVGINTAVHATGQGIGFAIPIDRAREVLNDLFNPEQLSDVFLGFSVADSAGRVMVTNVVRGGPADKANLAKGDFLKVLDGKALSSVFGFNKRLLNKKSGDKLRIDLERQGKLYRTYLTIGDKPSVTLVKRRLGLRAKTLTPMLSSARDYGTDEGVIIDAVEPKSPSARVGLQPGDIIVKVGQTVFDPLQGRVRKIFRIRSTEALAAFLDKRPPKTSVRIFVLRRGQEYQGDVNLR